MLLKTLTVVFLLIALALAQTTTVLVTTVVAAPTHTGSGTATGTMTGTGTATGTSSGTMTGTGTASGTGSPSNSASTTLSPTTCSNLQSTCEEDNPVHICLEWDCTYNYDNYIIKYSPVDGEQTASEETIDGETAYILGDAEDSIIRAETTYNIWIYGVLGEVQYSVVNGTATTADADTNPAAGNYGACMDLEITSVETLTNFKANAKTDKSVYEYTFSWAFNNSAQPDKMRVVLKCKCQPDDSCYESDRASNKRKSLRKRKKFRLSRDGLVTSWTTSIRKRHEARCFFKVLPRFGSKGEGFQRAPKCKESFDVPDTTFI